MKSRALKLQCLIACISITLLAGTLNSSYETVTGEYTETRWAFFRPTFKKLKAQLKKLKERLIAIKERRKNSIIKPFIDRVKQEFSQSPYANVKAYARVGQGLPQEEKNFEKKRLAFIKPHLEKMLGMKLDESTMPRIAFCCSGGGYRAMIATLGSFIGADSFDLVNSSLYASTLSGSTWFLAPWTIFDEPLKKFKERLIPKISESIANFPYYNPLYYNALLTKIIHKQPLSVVDQYGGLLANRFLEEFGNESQVMKLSDTQHKIQDGSYPLPIYTAIEAGRPFTWVEFTPFEVGSDSLNTFIPTWSLGRTFVNGASTAYEPEIPLSSLMGVWGSAFTVTFERALREMRSRIKPPELAEFIEKSITTLELEDQRFSPEKVHNFSYGLQSSPLAKNKTLTLVDAGIDFNLPFPPLLRPERNVDVIIVCDASKGGSALKNAARYAQANNLPFPQIGRFSHSTVTVFKDENNPAAPTVIYLPLVKNENFSPTFDPRKSDYVDTFDLMYTRDQVLELSGLTEANMRKGKDIIINEIKQRAFEKSGIKKEAIIKSPPQLV